MSTTIPTSFDMLGKAIYVSQQNSKASDDNPGTEEMPFLTISKAATVMSRYDEIIIDSGIYREEIELQVNGHCYTPEHVPVFRAAYGATVAIRGSDEFPAPWTHVRDNIYTAKLPDSLFEDSVYNPYERSLASDSPCLKVRPCCEDVLPETLGQLFVDGTAFKQVCSSLELNDSCWLVTADGKSILASFAEGISPDNCSVELTVRKQCFTSESGGVLFMEVRGIDVDHAAEPGPFCRCRRESLRQNNQSDIAVRKTFNVSGTTLRQCRLFAGEVSYSSTETNTIKASIYDESEPNSDFFVYDAISDDAALTWKPISDKYQAPASISEDTFLDEDLNVLVKTRVIFIEGGKAEDGCHVTNKDKLMAVYNISADEGKTWSKEQDIGLNMIPFRIIKLKDDTLLLPCGKNNFLANGNLHQSTHFFRGKWNESGDIDWSPGGTIEISPDKSACGLAEPHIAELPGGRIVVLLRMGAKLPSENSNGMPSVKLMSYSDDGGVNWSEPEPLKWDDGHMLYSPRSYQDIFCSRKNNKLYAILNICNEPTTGCDPRDVLQMVEIDSETLQAKRDAATIIEQRHPQAHSLIRFSNWLMFEDRETLNLIILMRLHMSEFCPIRHGYDLSSYRYEVEIS